MFKVRAKFTPFPTLKTERLILRRPQLEDQKQVLALRSNVEVAKYQDRPKARSINDARDFIQKIHAGVAKNEWILWAVTRKGVKKLIGTICLWNISVAEAKAEVGFELIPSEQGDGVMQEALAAVLEYGFEEMNLHSIEAYLHPENEQARKLLERSGFTPRATDSDAASAKEEIYVLAKPSLI